MYLAKENKNYNVPLYLSIFKNLEVGKGNSYKDEINEILIDTKDIVLGKKNIATISDEYYFLTSILIDCKNDFIQDLTLENINSEVYSKISKILESNYLFV